MQFPAGYYQYGRKQDSPGRIPGWLENLSNSATRMVTENASHDTISEDSTLGIDLLYSEADGSEQANEDEPADGSKQANGSEQVKSHKKDRCNSRYSLRPRINAPRRFHRGSSSGRALQEGGVM